MKRTDFLVGTGTALAVVAGAEAIAKAGQATANDITEMEWMPIINQAAYVKRWLVFGAFPGEERPHLHTSQMIPAYVKIHGHYGFNEEEMRQTARADLERLRRGERPQFTTTCRFNEYDVLPTEPQSPWRLYE